MARSVQIVSQPPSGLIVSPVMNEDSSAARNAISARKKELDSIERQSDIGAGNPKRSEEITAEIADIQQRLEALEKDYTEEIGMVREISPGGTIVWELIPVQDLPDYKVTGLQTVQRLPNGNTLLNNWLSQWGKSTAGDNQTVQAWEVTPDKKVAWALRSWSDPNLGPSTTIQILDEPSAPENAHFGSIK